MAQVGLVQSVEGPAEQGWGSLVKREFCLWMPAAVQAQECRPFLTAFPMGGPDQCLQPHNHCHQHLAIYPSIHTSHGASHVAPLGKNLPAKQEMWAQSLGQEHPLEKEMATHSSILAWEIPRTEETGGL